MPELIQVGNRVINLAHVTHYGLQIPDPDADDDQVVTLVVNFVDQTALRFHADKALMVWALLTKRAVMPQQLPSPVLRLPSDEVAA